jgi:putative acetyltransferase
MTVDVLDELFGLGPLEGLLKDPTVSDILVNCYNHVFVERDGRIEGGGGIAPLAGGDPDVCELRKMYFLPSLRGLGAGAALMQQCLDAAREHGFKRCYLETLRGMTAAQKLYERSGFARIDAPLGDTGHGGCNTFMLREL